MVVDEMAAATVVIDAVVDPGIVAEDIVFVVADVVVIGVATVFIVTAAVAGVFCLLFFCS